MTTRHARCWGVLLLLGLGCAGCATRSSTTGNDQRDGRRRGTVLVPAEASLQLATFERAWQRIAETYPHEDMRGIDWLAVRDELRPLARAARTSAELRPVMHEMFRRLGDSHFQVIPGEMYEPEEPAPQPATAPVDDASAGGTVSTIPTRRGRVGLQLRLLGDDLVVTRVESGGPAAIAGVRPGWILRAVDGTEVSELTDLASLDDQDAGRAFVMQAVHEVLSGPADTLVKLQLIHGDDAAATVELRRAPDVAPSSTIGHLPTLSASLDHEVLGGTNVGYVRFDMFLAPVALPFTEAIEEFVERGVDGIVVDLRGNPGGLGGMVMGMGGHFIAEHGRSLGRMKTRGGELDFVANPRAAIFDGPLAVLVDGMSFSTSELFAAGLQELGRARVFGVPTPGMAMPSVVESLPNGDRMQFAIGDLLGPEGRRLEGHGVVPDQEIRLTRESLLEGRDLQVEAAVEWIHSGGEAGGDAS